MPQRDWTKFTRGGTLAKAATQRKPPPEPNQDAVRKMAEERRRSAPAPPPNKFETKRSPGAEEAFLDGLREGWSIKKSAWAVPIASSTAWAWRYKSEATKQEDGSYTDDFYPRWRQAEQDGVDRLEDEATRRGVEGVEKPVYQGGVLVGTVTEYSDTLLNLKLRGKRPEVYNTERHEMSGPNGGAIPVAMEIEFVDVKAKK